MSPTPANTPPVAFRTTAASSPFDYDVQVAFLEGESGCFVPSILVNTVTFYTGGWLTYQKLITILAGIATIVTLFVCLVNVTGHLTNWVRPQEQKQIVRAILLLPVFGLCSFFSIWFYPAANYLEPVPQIYEPFAIVALFYFYVVLATPDEESREAFYAGFERRGRLQNKVKHNHGSLRWFHTTYICVFQLLLLRISTTIASFYIVATDCPLSPHLRRSQMVIKLIQALQTTVAVIAVIGFERRLSKTQLFAGHRAAAKLWTLKSIVGIEIVQNIVFQALTTAKVWTPTPHVSYFDFVQGTPAFMLAVEMAIYACVFYWSFAFAPYKASGHARAAASSAATGEAPPRVGRQTSAGRAMLDVLNIMDLIRGLVAAFRMCRPSVFGKGGAWGRVSLEQGHDQHEILRSENKHHLDSSEGSPNASRQPSLLPIAHPAAAAPPTYPDHEPLASHAHPTFHAYAAELPRQVS